MPWPAGFFLRENAAPNRISTTTTAARTKYAADETPPIEDEAGLVPVVVGAFVPTVVERIDDVEVVVDGGGTSVVVVVTRPTAFVVVPELGALFVSPL